MGNFWLPAKPRDYTVRPSKHADTSMKKLALLAALMLATGAQAQTHKLTQLWETEATLKVPESVLFDAGRKVLYVSNIDGEPWAADGKGSIAKVGLDGKVIAAEWVSGLD